MIRDRRGQVSPFPLWLAGVVALIVFVIVACDVLQQIPLPASSLKGAVAALAILAVGGSLSTALYIAHLGGDGQ